METKFTPGPWSVGYNAYQVTADNGNMNVCDIRGWGYLTGKGSLGLSEDKAKEIQEANAHLIASSPELYEALEMVLKFHHDNEAHGDGFLHDHEVEKIESALAKARGENTNGEE